MKNQTLQKARYKMKKRKSWAIQAQPKLTATAITGR
jgi:hypothetical protein